MSFREDCLTLVSMYKNHRRHELKVQCAEFRGIYLKNMKEVEGIHSVFSLVYSYLKMRTALFIFFYYYLRMSL